MNPSSFSSSEEEGPRALAKETGLPYQADVDCPPQSLLKMFPKKLAEEHGVFPLDYTDIKDPADGKLVRRTIKIAIANPYDFETLDLLHHLFSCDIESVVVPKRKIEEGLRNYYGPRA
jgi:hypothetical protein